MSGMLALGRSCSEAPFFSKYRRNINLLFPWMQLYYRGQGRKLRQIRSSCLQVVVLYAWVRGLEQSMTGSVIYWPFLKMVYRCFSRIHSCPLVLDAVKSRASLECCRASVSCRNLPASERRQLGMESELGLRCQ